MGLRALRRAPALLVFEMPSVAFLREPLGFKSHKIRIIKNPTLMDKNLDFSGARDGT